MNVTSNSAWMQAKIILLSKDYMHLKFCIWQFNGEARPARQGVPLRRSRYLNRRRSDGVGDAVRIVKRPRHDLNAKSHASSGSAFRLLPAESLPRVLFAPRRGGFDPTASPAVQGRNVFLTHQVVELSTNLAENSMRGMALGPKNWTHLGSAQAGPKVAVRLPSPLLLMAQCVVRIDACRQAGREVTPRPH